jgi:NAD(P)-dependent dehydrogenase (short-subunit alcohol dehydrogenase family)
MLPRNRGIIIQVGSALAYRSIPLQSAYCAAKHAVLGFTESLRTELIHDGSAVRVSIVELPAVNTPQFDWVKSRLPRKPQPVPPIFQPEVPAQAIAFAATHARREYKVGFPTLKAILAEKIAPGFADHYLARNGYDSQQTHEAADPERPDNLYHPLPGDHGAHGRFDSRSRPFSLQLWLTEHRPLVAALGAGLVGAGVSILGNKRKAA